MIILVSKMMYIEKSTTKIPYTKIDIQYEGQMIANMITGIAAKKKAHAKPAK
jgi:hypothetical protein